MAGKQFPSLAHARRASSRCLLAVGALLVFSAVYFLLLSPSPPRPVASPLSNPSTTTSFVASLDRFLDSPHHPAASSAAPGDLDAAIRSEEEARLYGDPRGAWPAAPAPLRVYVYEMPRKFTYDLLRLFRDSYRDTANLTSNGSPVHRLIEQRLLKNVIRVERQEEADIFYVPFFTTISYFLLEKQECKALYREALKWMTDQPAWQRSEGRDHVIPVHHPWSFKSVRRFVKKAMWLLPDMDSTGNWYKPGQVYLEKDVILPYVPNVDLCDYKCVSETQSKRSTLLFFRGRLKRNAGGKIRSKLVAELQNIEDIIIEEGSAGAKGKVAAQTGMRKSLFCLNPAGDTPSSARLFDAIVSGCIPVIISDELELPFEGILDYSKIALFVSSTDAVQPGWLVKYLRGIDAKRVREMQSNLLKYSKHFLYSSPAQPLGPEDLTWRMIAGKLVNIKLHIQRSRRVVRESRSVCTCECRVGNTTRML
ncbi:probable arabinosyltransferase ARAD1 isoform X2 [Triticum dicoccoides]|uniref:Exostosin GT47 domain-containing protein n=1 Tax=Triticum urartu TaxID=4572 RepID=A0A8R7PVX8_TRIUA|nr:probable arabinosyltransferase ARAD1 isoform X2 [Triticum dicoccoides]XP_044341793.1 probable arabinosyltransferase ARAD1 isoform X2 [Triticum aestivum]